MNQFSNFLNNFSYRWLSIDDAERFYSDLPYAHNRIKNHECGIRCEHCWHRDADIPTKMKYRLTNNDPDYFVGVQWTKGKEIKFKGVDIYFYLCYTCHRGIILKDV